MNEDKFTYVGEEFYRGDCQSCSALIAEELEWYQDDEAQFAVCKFCGNVAAEFNPEEDYDYEEDAESFDQFIDPYELAADNYDSDLWD